MRRKEKEYSIKRAALINAVSKYTSVFVQLCISFVLARILTPEDYGIVAIVTVFINFFGILSNLGIADGIVQNKTLNDHEVNNIFRFTFRLGAIAMVAFSLFSVPFSTFYDEPVLRILGMMLSVTVFLSSINMVPNALLMKNKRFMLIARRNIVIPLISGIVAVALAYCGLKYYALVIQSILMSALYFIVNIISTNKDYDLRIEKKYNDIGIKKIKEYSGFQFGFNLVNYFSRNLDNLLIGRFFGTASLGYYDKAYKLMQYPQGYITDAVAPVLHPILSDYQNNKDIIFEKYLKLTKLMSIIGVFIVVYCIYDAEEIITILYGEKWVEAAPYFSILALSVWAQMINGLGGSIFQSAGNTKLLFFTGCITSCISVIAIVVGVLQNSLINVAIYVSVAYCIHFVIATIMIVSVMFKINYLSFIRNFIPDFISFFVMFGLGLFINNYFSIENVFFAAIFKLFFFGIVYYILCKVFGQYKYIYILLPKKNKID